MIRTAIVILCCVLGFGAALRSRFGALLFYMWIAFFRPQEWVWVSIEFLRLSFISGLLVIVPSLLTFRLPTLSHPLCFGSLLFVLCATVGYQSAVEPDVSWYWVVYVFTLVVVTSFMVTLTDTPRRFVLLLGMITGSFAFYSAKAGLVALLAGGARFGSGLAGAFSDSNAYATGAVMIIYPLIFVAQNVKTRWIRYGMWAAAPLTALTVVSTFSRAGFLALVLSGLVFILLQRRRGLLLFAAALCVPLALIVVPIPEGYFDRLQTIRTYEEVDETSALSRLYFWQVALKMAAAKPLGIGPWQYEANYDHYDELGIYGSRRSVHNSFLQALTEAGWAGGSTFVLLFVASWRILFRLRAQARSDTADANWQHFLLTASNALIASMVGFVIGGNFIAMAYNDLTWITFGLVATLDLLARQHASRVAGLPTEMAPHGQAA